MFPFAEADDVVWWCVGSESERLSSPCSGSLARFLRRRLRTVFRSGTLDSGRLVEVDDPAGVRDGTWMQRFSASFSMK
jgi:hypothetical protein